MSQITSTIAQKIADSVGKEGVGELVAKGDSLSIEDLPVVKLSAEEMAHLNGGLMTVRELIDWWNKEVMGR